MSRIENVWRFHKHACQIIQTMFCITTVITRRKATSMRQGGWWPRRRSMHLWSIMPVEDLVGRLASLSLRSDRAPLAGNSKTPGYNSEDEDAIGQLRSHLARVRLDSSKAGSSQAALRKAAKQDARGLLKIAQTGLRNTAGGLEPLRLAYAAVQTLAPLSPFVGAADLFIEKLWYQVIARSVDLGDFALGLRASASLQACLDEREGHVARRAGGYCGGDGWLVLTSEGEGNALRLGSFAPPESSASLEVARIVSGASLNACRCCLELGSSGSLGLMMEGLGCSAGEWIDRVCDLGDAAKAEAHRDHLFKLLWRACSVLEQPSLVAKPGQCLLGRQTALKVLLQKGDSWNTNFFVGQAHRAAVALEHAAGGGGGGTSAGDAAKLSTFCMEALSDREGADWPRGRDGGEGEVMELNASWVEWLQHSAGLQEKTGDSAEAQRLLQVAYEYVQRCWKEESRGAGGHRAAACAAYLGALKMRAAVTITSQYPLPRPTPAGKLAAKKPVGKRADVSSCPSSVTRSHISRGLEYLDDVSASLGALAADAGGRGKGAGEEVAAFIGAAVKSWRWTQKSCGAASLWVEEVGGGGGDRGGSGNVEAAEWSELHARGLRGLGYLSQMLGAVRRCATGSIVERMPLERAFSELAVESYLRAAQVHLSALTSANQGDLGSVRNQSQGITAEDGARQTLCAAEEMGEVNRGVFVSQYVRQAGAGWFGLGMSLFDSGKVNAGLDAAVRGCRLLESWANAEVSPAGQGAAYANSGYLSETMRSAHLDLRLSKLSKALQESGENALAASASARALSFCPELWCISPDGRVEPPAAALILVERYVYFRLQGCQAAGNGTRDSSGRAGASGPALGAAKVSSVASAAVAAYLSDGDCSPCCDVTSRSADAGLSAMLQKRRCPSSGVAWALLAECRAYRSQLPLYVSSGSARAAGGGRGALSACIEGHRRATGAVLNLCRGTAGETYGAGTGLAQADMWEAHARVLAAGFEHDLFLADTEEKGGVDNADNGAGGARMMADLRGGMCQAASGAKAASSARGGAPPSSSATAAAATGVFSCIQAMLLRDLAESSDDVEHAMRKGLDSLGEAARESGWTPESTWPASFGQGDAASIAAHLEVLETHYTLHGDTLRRARAAEIRFVLSGRIASADDPDISPRATAASAAALSSIGAAFHAAGLPALGPIYGAAAEDNLCDVEDSARRRGRANSGTDGASLCAQIEVARVGVSVLRGLCLAERSSSTREAEEILTGVRKAVTDPKTRVVSPVTAAYLECLAGMGLSWMFERSGRLMEAMEEVRRVLRLCRAWASAGGPFSSSDRQIVSLSAAKGTCVHDEESGGKAAAPNHSQVVEEGVGEESGDVEETIGSARTGGGGPGGEGVALNSLWIPIYLEGLTRMGRVWRARGFASKASGYLRQGCVASEPLRAARFLRRCLLEEIGVATGMHRFARADRLLRASQDLLRQEQRGLSSEKGNPSTGCAACRGLESGDAGDSEAARPVATKGKGSRKGGKKRGGKAKSAVARAAAASPGRCCVRCRELALNAAELSVSEAALSRKRGNFRGALDACARGQAILAPLIYAASGSLQMDDSLTFTSVSSQSRAAEGQGEGQGLGWRALEILAALRLHQGRAAYLLGDSTAAQEAFRECADTDGFPVLVRADALYRLGRMCLGAGDTAGARAPLERAEALTRGAGAPKLVRAVRRMLAVALARNGNNGGGGDRVGVDGSWKVAALSCLSIGVTHCNQVAHASARLARKDGKAPQILDASAGLRLFDVVSGGGVATVGEAKAEELGQLEGSKYPDGRDCLRDAVASDLRAEWPIVTLCLSPGEGGAKRLLLTRLVRGRSPLTASIPLPPEDAQLLARWQGVMDENRDTLRGHSAEEAAGWGNKEKGLWWKRRDAVDEAVGDLLRELEERWLAVHGLTAALLGEVMGERLALDLESVFEFAKGRISAARRAGGGVGGKAASRGKAGKRPRGVATAGARADSEAAGGLSSGLSELVCVCVRGGDVVGEEAWVAVVRMALSDVASEEGAAVEAAREIHERVRQAFEGAALEGGGSIGVRAPVPAPSKDEPCLAIERDRSASNPTPDGKAETAASRRSPPPARTVSITDAALSKMKVADLRRELSSRGIAFTGLKLKTDLLSRLAEAVREEAEVQAEARGGKLEGVGSNLGDVREDQDRGDSNEASRSPAPGERVGTSRTGRASVNSSPPTSSRSAVDTSDNAGYAGSDISVDGGGRRVVDRHPVVLVLDEELQAIPWEGLPCLRGRAVTRVPAVPFVFSALAARWDGHDDRIAPSRTTSSKKAAVKGSEQTWVPSRDGVRLSRGYYVLDPEANLPHTRKQLGPVFEGIERRLGWSGVKGKVPMEEAMAQTLQEVDIFAYCGHGAGELLVGREAVAGLTRCAVAVLMGCSSGRLKGYGDFEPSGMVSSYLAAGSPAVVANLWDVTDRDIDRYSVALLEAFVGDGGEGRRLAPTLAHAVAEARSECKLPYIIGHAPVCYGIPLAAARPSHPS